MDNDPTATPPAAGGTPAAPAAAPASSPPAPVPQLVLGRMRNGAPIDEAQLEKQLALLNDNPGYADALLNRMGISRALSEAEQIREELAQTKLEIQREKIIARHKVPDELEPFVHGKTPEEMETSAKQLMAALEARAKAAGDPAAGGVKPGPQPRAGYTPPAVIPPINGGGNGQPLSVAEAVALIKDNYAARR